MYANGRKAKREFETPRNMMPNKIHKIQLNHNLCFQNNKAKTQTPKTVAALNYA